jgi:flavin-dependent dehydrogenase
LAGHGLRVVLVDRKDSLSEAVHTTGIFVRRSLEDFSLPPAYLGPPIRHVTLYSPARRRLELESSQDEFRIGRMGALYTRMLGDCRAAGAEWLSGACYLGREDVAGGSKVHLKVDGQSRFIQARYLVAADGTQSRVARDLGLSTNRRWIVGLEEIFSGVPLTGPPRLHAFLDHRLAPGYIAWIAEDGQSAHVGVGGYSARFQPAAALDRFRSTIRSIVPLDGAQFLERRGGRIPVGGILPNLVNSHGILIGDAAGAVSPLTAGGLDPCLRLSELAAKVVWQYLASGNEVHLAAYDGREFRRAFRARRALRAVYSIAGRNPLFEAAFAVVRLPLVRSIAKRVFFGRRSFPDVTRAARSTRARSAGKPQNPQAIPVN